MFEIILRLAGANGQALAGNLPLRAGLAAFTAFAVTALATRWLIGFLGRLHVAERVDKKDSEKLAELHGDKKDTPTLGGLALVFGMTTATLLWTDLANAYVWTGVLLVAGFAGLGLLDDWIKLVREDRKGLTIRGKLTGQLALGAAAAAGLYLLGRGPDGLVEVYVPLLPSFRPALPGILFLGFAVVVLVATVNAVNFTDGLDGLASGCAVITGVPLAAFAALAGSAGSAASLAIPYVEGAGELAVFGAALGGTGLGFLWHNCFPARLFMGDTGSMALGAAIGYMALAVKMELLLPLVGAVFVAEGLSVLLQVLSFRITGRRLFLIAPLHHRYQFLGWPETRITIRFWISAAVSAAAGAFALQV